MNGRPAFPAEDLIQAGLNRQHVFALADLPETLRAKLGAQARDRQLILLGHGGRALWEAMQAAAPTRSNDPIDDYTRVAVDRCLQRILPLHAYRFLYPGVSVDPSKRKTGGALLGDRIRMNAIGPEIAKDRVYMRSLATRQSNLALSRYVQDAVDILKAAQFDLIILEYQRYRPVGHRDHRSF